MIISCFFFVVVVNMLFMSHVYPYLVYYEFHLSDMDLKYPDSFTYQQIRVILLGKRATHKKGLFIFCGRIGFAISRKINFTLVSGGQTNSPPLPVRVNWSII
jgi:hypothetical protein